mgnify:CR=1 FL=1
MNLDLYNDLLLKEKCMILIYGEAGSGKTNLTLFLLAKASRNGRRGIYISTEGKIYQALVDQDKFTNVFFSEVYDLNELSKLIFELKTLLDKLDDKKMVIVVDTINSLYRLQENLEHAVTVLNMQLALLYKLSRLGCTVIVTGQVRERLEEEVHTTTSVDVSGSTYLRFWPDIIIRLERVGVRRMLIVEKPIDMELGFEIKGPANIVFYKLLQ